MPIDFTALSGCSRFSGNGYMPQLVTIEGEDSTAQIAELLGVDYDDAMELETVGINEHNIDYFNSKYPEYMGIWPIIAKVASTVVGGVAKGVKAIASAVKKKKAAKKSSSDKKKAEEAAAAKAEEERLAAIAEAKRKADEQKKMLLTIGIPAAALLAFMAFRRK